MHAFVTSVGQRRARAGGFTLIELMTVLTIAAILITLGAPALGEFVADQRVRTTASDIASEIAYARAKAIEASRRVYIERTGLLWRNGWRIYADLNNNAAFDAGEELKRFDGFPPTGTMYVCAVATAPDFASNLVFRPDGRVMRTTAVGANDGIYVVDTLGDADVCNNKIRGLLFGLSGRVTTINLISGTSCRGVAPPC